MAGYSESEPDDVREDVGQKRMYVVKRDGTKQEMSFDKVSRRIQELCNLDGKLKEKLSPLKNVNFHGIALKVIGNITDGIKTSDLDVIAAQLTQPMITEHLEYGELAARLLISNHHKNCEQLLIDRFMPHRMRSSGSSGLDASNPDEGESIPHLLFTARALWENIDINGRHAPMIAPHVLKFIELYWKELEGMLDYERDYKFNYAGFEMAMGSYLLQCSLAGAEVVMPDGRRDVARFVIERPQHMWMRVALGIWLDYPSTPYRDLLETAANKSAFWETYIAGISDDQIKSMYSRMDRIRRTYEILSNMDAMHATPTLFHSGSVTPQMSSCFLTTVPSDSLDSIADYYKILMMISKWAGGLGSHVHHIRPTGSYIGGTGGTSNGLVPMLRVANEIAKYVDQGGSKRPGSHAVYLEMWHGDISEFIDLKLGRGNMENRARSLFYAVWIPDEFMRCVEEEERRIQAGIERDPQLWYLMDPVMCPKLADAYDEIHRTQWIPDSDLFTVDGASTPVGCRLSFTSLYRRCIRDGKFMRRVSARSLWKQICRTTEETGVPYKLFKDAINRKNNQANLGTIKSSNLCCEITEFSSPEETAVCNLGSICLNNFVVYSKPANAAKYKFSEGFPINLDLTDTSESEMSDGSPRIAWFDFERLGSVVRTMVRNLDQVITQNYYPTAECKRSNMRHRPIGLGVQGLADCFTLLWLPFDSDGAMKLDYYIFETMNYESKLASMELAKESGKYVTYTGSPMANGMFQRDMWEKEHAESDRSFDWNPTPYPRSRDWKWLLEETKKHGQRNSLTLALMPTASTSTLTGNSPAFEPHNALIYKRRDKMGESYVCNLQLQRVLMARGLWTTDVQIALMKSRTGSIAEITSIPKQIRDIFKTAFDMSAKVVLNHALIRGSEIDQSQSMNVFIPAADHQILTQTVFYIWRRGGKTGCYYLRQLPAVDAKKIQLLGSDIAGLATGSGLKPPPSASAAAEAEESDVCTMQDGCVTCSS